MQSPKFRPSISVVTVCYNAVEYIEECLQSVKRQELPGVEHVVIDGGSSDGTVEVIKRNAKQLAYWHSLPDRGVGHAFNLGVQHSRGDWILFLNADDYFSRPDALTILANQANSMPNAEIVYGMVQPVTRAAQPVPIGRPVGWNYSPFRFLLQDLIPHPATLTSRAYFARVGSFREDLRIVVDYEHFLREYRTLRTTFVPQVTTHMRAGGLSSDSAATLEEMFRAHKVNRVLSHASMAVLQTYIRSKAACGRAVRSAPGIRGLLQSQNLAKSRKRA